MSGVKHTVEAVPHQTKRRPQRVAEPLHDSLQRGSLETAIHYSPSRYQRGAEVTFGNGPIGVHLGTSASLRAATLTAPRRPHEGAPRSPDPRTGPAARRAPAARAPSRPCPPVGRGISGRPKAPTSGRAPAGVRVSPTALPVSSKQ